MEDSLIMQKHQALELKILESNREHNIIKLYIFVVLLAAIAMTLVSKWGRTKLLEYTHRIGIDSVCQKLSAFISRPKRTKIRMSDGTDAEKIKLVTTKLNDPRPKKELFE